MAEEQSDTAFEAERAEDPYARFVEQCCEGLASSPGDQERIGRVKLLLAAAGITHDDARAAAWLAPAVCSSAAEQQLFHARFEAYRRGGPGWSTADTDLEAPPPAPRRYGFRAFFLRYALPLAAIPALLGALVLWSVLRPEPVVRQPAPVVVINKTTGLKETRPPEYRPQPDTLAIAMLAGMAAVAAALLLLERRRRRRLARSVSPAPRLGRAAVHTTDLPRLFSEPGLTKRLGILRRHKDVPSRRMEVRRSIRATIRAGGRAQIRFGSRPATPEYLLLVDRQSPRDHLPFLADALQAQFAREKIVLSRYDYTGNAARLRTTPSIGGDSDLSLADVAARHGGSRFLALAEPRDCFSEAESNPWTHLFEALDEPALLDPRGPHNWTRLERLLEESGVLVVPATPGGLDGYAERLSARGGKWPAPWSRAGAARGDGGDSLLADKRRLIDETAPSRVRLDELMLDLEHLLGPEAFLLLRVVALYPAVEPALTLHLAASLKGPRGRPLLSEEVYLAVARLPWMRSGHLPAWLRKTLIQGLDPALVSEATAHIQSFIVPRVGDDGRPAVDEARGPDQRLRQQILAWIGEHPESDLYDPILFDALQGRPPAQIGRASDPNRPGRPLSSWRRQDATFAALLVAALAGAAWLNPPLPRVAVEAASPRAEDRPNKAEAPKPADRQPGVVAVPPSSTKAEENASAAAEVGAIENGQTEVPTAVDPPVLTPEQTQPTGRPSPPPPTGPVGPWMVFFDWGKDDITAYAAAILDNMADAYKQSGGASVFIAAHTDREGAADYNLGLSQRMGNNVRAYLEARGVPSGAITVQAFGESRNLVETRDGVREPQNRRVEITLGPAAGW